MKIYCLECNKPTEYSDIKPNFCAYCQHPFAGSTAKTTKKFPLPKKRSRKVEEEEDYEDEDFDEVEEMDFGKIEIEPLREDIRASEKLSDILLAQPTPNQDKFNRPHSKKKVSRKKFQEDWARELTDKKSREIGGE